MQLPLHNKRIIVAPLFWGLGHATRCEPIIRQLIQQGNTVSIASDGEALTYLQQEFPEVESFELPAYNIKYKSESMAINMIVQGPKLLRAINREKAEAKKLANSWKADVIISDNRLGFRADGIYSVYITHQLTVLGENSLQTKLATSLHKKYYSKFDECWVPDYQGKENLAGDLSQSSMDIPTLYIGPVTRLICSEEPSYDIDVLVILSGPEPQRTYLEEALQNELTPFKDAKVVIVRGTQKKQMPGVSTVKTYDLLGTAELNKLLNRTKLVVCRAGYSSIMDLVALGKKAILIPTPGQTEQEYLAQRLDAKYGFKCLEQKNISNLKSLISQF